MSAQTGYVADALVAELVRAAHKRGVRAGLEAAATVADAHKGSAKAKRLAKSLPRVRNEEMVQSIRDEERGEDIASDLIARAIRSIDPATVKDTGDGRE